MNRSKYFPLIAIVLFTRATLFAQGPLTPPGPPAPTMKTLDQLEPRKPISSLPFTANAPGSYYLTTNLAGTSGINITASHVSIDLNGFTLDGTGSGSMVRAFTITGTRSNIYIANGTVRSWGGKGLQAFSSGYYIRLHNLHAANNGGTGFELGRFSEARNCSATANGAAGFDSNNDTVFVGCVASTNSGVGIGGSNGGQLIEQCIAQGNVSHGFFGNTLIIKDCIVRGNGRHGMSVNDARITDCVAAGNATNGISAGLSSFVSDCLVNGNGARAIEVSGGCKVINNHCYDNGRTVTGAGIEVTSTGNHIEGNRVVNNDRGIEVMANQNIIIRNSAQFNGGNNYVIAAGNMVGPSVNSATIGTSSNPHANYDF